MKASKSLIITAIVLLVVIAVSLVGLMVKLMNGGFNAGFKFFDLEDATELVVDKTFDASVSLVDMNVDVADVYFNNSSDDKVRLVIYGEKEDTTYDVINGKMTVNVKSKPCNFFCLNRLKFKVEVYLPSSYEGEVKLVNNYGDIKVDDFVNANIDIKSNAGDIEIDSLKEARVESDYGDVYLDTAKVATIKNDCGDVEVNEVGRVSIENDLGDVKLGKVLERLDVEANCGDVKISSLNLLENSTIKNDLGDVEIGMTNSIYIDATTSLGDVSVKNNYRESSVVLKIDNSCGDITVNN